MAKVNLGRVGFVMQGNHSTSKTYKRLDCVTSNGVMYSAKEDVPTGIAINNETYWQKIFDGEEVMDSKMERYVIKLTKNGETYSLTDIDNQAVTFNSLYSTLRDLSKYVVCVYGNSKLRPQYVSTNEMLFIGLDRASSSSKVLRMHVTPTAIRYETFELAEKLYVDTELNKKASAATMAAFAQNLGNLEGDVDELKDDIAHLGAVVEGGKTVTESWEGVTEPVKTNGGYIGYNGNFFANDMYKNCLVPCKPGDKFRVTSTCNGTLVLAVYFSGTESSLVRVDSFSGSLQQQTTYTNEIVTIPAGCTYVAFNGTYAYPLAIEKYVVTTEYEGGIMPELEATQKLLEETQKKIEEVVGTTEEKSDFFPVDQEIQQGLSYTVNAKGGYSNDSYRSIVCPCHPGDVFKVSANCIASIVLCLFYNGEPSNETYVGVYSGSLAERTVYTDELVTIPDGCTYVAFNDSVYYAPVLSVKKKVTWQEPTSGLRKEVNDAMSAAMGTMSQYRIVDGVLMLRWHYSDGKDAVMCMNNGRGNGLFDFYRFGTVPADADMSKIMPDGIEQVWANGTDWHAPFQLRASNNGNGDDVDNYTFTGGNHQYNNSGSGSTATASSKYVRFFADGKPVTDGVGYANRFTIEWKNGVQAQNTRKANGTGREVLEETHIMEFDGGRFNETVRLKALEALTMILWYGFQFSNRASVYPNVVYIGGANRAATTADSSNSGNNKPNGIHAYGSAHCIDTWIDTDYDLGKRDNYSGTSGAFTSNGKAYYNTATNLSMAAGEVYSLRGGYMFTPVIGS